MFCTHTLTALCASGLPETTGKPMGSNQPEMVESDGRQPSQQENSNQHIVSVDIATNSAEDLANSTTSS